MQKFQDLLAEAAQLKQSQLKKQRKNYESLPQYIKSGLNFAKKYQYLRRQDYMLQMNLSQKLKRQGNKLFNASLYTQALNKYEQALGIFRYINAKTYDNMKDEDMIYQFYTLPQQSKEYQDQYQKHLIALYLNICSCLTKMNKKEDAIHSADEALKIKQTAKGYYKKAHAYLKFINRDTPDIKLGFYYLNKSYQISKDQSIIEEMHKIKKQIDDEKEKEKKWFKFMFDKNSKQPEPLNPNNYNSKVQQASKKQQQIKAKSQQPFKSQALKNLQRQQKDKIERQDQKLQKTKQKLSKFTLLSYADEQWLQLYQGEFILKHGSKIYSIIQVYGYKEYLGQYKSLLAQCLEYKKQLKCSTRRKQVYNKYFQWLKSHPIDKILKYTERYKLQVKWIQEQRLIKRSVLQSNHKDMDRKYVQTVLLPPQKMRLDQQQRNETKNSNKQAIVADDEDNVPECSQNIEMIEETLGNILNVKQFATLSHHQQNSQSQKIENQVIKEQQPINREFPQGISQEFCSNIKQNANYRFKYYSIFIALLLILTLKLLY